MLRLRRAAIKRYAHPRSCCGIARRSLAVLTRPVASSAAITAWSSRKNCWPSQSTTLCSSAFTPKRFAVVPWSGASHKPCSDDRIFPINHRTLLLHNPHRPSKKSTGYGTDTRAPSWDGWRVELGEAGGDFFIGQTMRLEIARKVSLIGC
jgi:hypothetical protein